MANTEGAWLTITDYSALKKVSISTIRRHIKGNVIKWKREEGKYYLWTQSRPIKSPASEIMDEEHLHLKLQIQELKQRLKSAEEELLEAKMLISLYEQKSLERNFELSEPPKFLLEK
jgi:hypothetical protein